MIHIKTLDLYREFQKNIMKVVESEALMSGFNEYTVSIRNHSTEVTIYLHGYAAVLTFYISGRVVVKYVVSKNDHEETVIIDKTDWQYLRGRCTVADLVSRYVYKVFDVALDMRQRRRADCRDRHKEKKESEEKELAVLSEAEPLEQISDQPHTTCSSAEDYEASEDNYSEVIKDSYIANFVHDF